jgi:H+/Cl- antiporter ClcA
VAAGALGGLWGGVAAAAMVIAVTLVLKAILAVVSDQRVWILIVVPLVGLAASVLVLYGFGRSAGAQQRKAQASAWRTFPARVARSDLTGELVAYAGEEGRFPWRLAPIRIVAIVATVGLGAPMGTEAPAAYMGVALGSALLDRSRKWRRLIQPAAVGGAAGGVAALMGIPWVGASYILELGRRHQAPLSAERVTAALVGGVVGWLMNLALGVDLLRLVVPKEPPHSMPQAVITASLIGALAGSITSIAGSAIYRAKAWHTHPALRLVLAGSVMAATTVTLAFLAAPGAAVGPGGGAITWIENTEAAATTVLAVAALRAMATTSAAAAGGCGGLFVPFMAIGDLGGRVFAVAFGVPADLAGAAGAASGIAGGYRLPFTAVALVLGQGGPHPAMLTCLAAVAVATLSGELVGTAMNRFFGLGRAYIAKRSRSP